MIAKLKFFFSMFSIRFYRRLREFGTGMKNPLYEFGITIERPIGTVCDDNLDIGLSTINGKIFLVFWFINFSFPVSWPHNLDFEKISNLPVEVKYKY